MPSDQFRLTKSRAAVLQVSVLVVALCGIVYELLIATVSSYLLGDSVRQFSVTIGLFMAAMELVIDVTTCGSEVDLEIILPELKAALSTDTVQLSAEIL